MAQTRERRSWIFKWHLFFFIQIIVLATCLQKTGDFARHWPLARAKFTSLFLIFASGGSSTVQAHFSNKIFRTLCTKMK
jgi:hypothetical protein